MYYLLIVSPTHFSAFDMTLCVQRPTYADYISRLHYPLVQPVDSAVGDSKTFLSMNFANDKLYQNTNVYCAHRASEFPYYSPLSPVFVSISNRMLILNPQ